jgi:hypothetical protein
MKKLLIVLALFFVLGCTQIEPVNCGQDMACFQKALTSCTPAVAYGYGQDSKTNSFFEGLNNLEGFNTGINQELSYSLAYRFDVIGSVGAGCKIRFGFDTNGILLTNISDLEREDIKEIHCGFVMIFSNDRNLGNAYIEESSSSECKYFAESMKLKLDGNTPDLLLPEIDMLPPVNNTSECNVDLDCPNKSNYDVGVCIEHTCWIKKSNCYRYSASDTGRKESPKLLSSESTGLDLIEVKFSENTMNFEIKNNTTHDLTGFNGPVFVILEDSRFLQNGENITSDFIEIPIGQTRNISLTIDPSKTPYGQTFFEVTEVMFRISYGYLDAQQQNLTQTVDAEYFCKPN